MKQKHPQPRMVAPETTQATQKTENVLAIVNRASGLRRSDNEVDALRRAFDDHFRSAAKRDWCVVEDHDAVIRVTQEYIAASPKPVFLLSCGGGGTLRAMVQGVMMQVERGAIGLSDVFVSSLRLGSGNLVPKLFGIPADPFLALGNIARNWESGSSRDCSIYRCEYKSASATKSEYGVALGLFGPLARAPNDVHDSKQRHRTTYRFASRVLGIEQVNNLHYAAFGLVHVAQCLINPRRADLLAVKHAGKRESFRILAGMLMNFDIAALPVRANCKIGEPRFCLGLVRLDNRLQTIRNLLSRRNLDRQAYKYTITPDDPVEIEFLESDVNIIALDEDSFVAPSRLAIAVAGAIRFVGGET